MSYLFILLLIIVASSLIIIGLNYNNIFYSSEVIPLSKDRSPQYHSSPIPNSSVGKDGKKYNTIAPNFENVNIKMFIEFIYSEHRMLSNGKFVEICNVEGEYDSISSDLEEKYNWSGLLIQANNEKYERLTKDEKRNITTKMNVGICKNEEKINIKQLTNIPCKNMLSILSDNNMNQISLFILGIEDRRKLIIEDIDFSKVQINYMLLRINAKIENAEDNEIRGILKNNGYKLSTKNDEYELWENPSIYYGEHKIMGN